MSDAALPLPLAPEGTTTPRWRAEAALVVAAFFFGTTFIVVQNALDDADPVPFLAVRFLLGAAVLAVVAHRRRPGTADRPPRTGLIARPLWRHGVAAGLALLIGYVLQTIGLQHTTTTASAFITYLLVVIVPILAFVVLGRRPHPLTIGGIALAVTGLVLLTGGAETGLGSGELLTLGSAVGFAAHIVILGEIAGRHDPVRLTAVQLSTVGVGTLVPSLFTGGLRLPPAALGAAAFTGVFATALAFLAMVYAQRVVSATRAVLLLLLEPVFAATIGWFAGEALTAGMIAGGVLILAAVIIAEVLPGVVGARSTRRPGGSFEGDRDLPMAEASAQPTATPATRSRPRGREVA